MQKNGTIALTFHVLVLAFVLAPLVIICLVAFTPENTLSLPTTGLSLRWFKAVFAHPDFMASFWNSIWLAALSATLAVAFAVPAPRAGLLHGAVCRRRTGCFLRPFAASGRQAVRRFVCAGIRV